MGAWSHQSRLPLQVRCSLQMFPTFLPQANLPYQPPHPTPLLKLAWPAFIICSKTQFHLTTKTTYWVRPELSCSPFPLHHLHPFVFLDSVPCTICAPPFPRPSSTRETRCARSIQKIDEEKGKKTSKTRCNMPENQARQPGAITRRWQPIRSVDAQERLEKMKQKAREQGISDEQIEAGYIFATEEAARGAYEKPCSATLPIINAGFFYLKVDIVFRSQILKRKDPFEFEGGLGKWSDLTHRSRKPWSPEYLEYYMQRTLLDGEGRGTATTQDGETITLHYERRVEDPASDRPQSNGSRSLWPTWMNKREETPKQTPKKSDPPQSSGANSHQGPGTRSPQPRVADKTEETLTETLKKRAKKRSLSDLDEGGDPNGTKRGTRRDAEGTG